MPTPLLEAIQERSARVAVIGLGYVGLPLACAAAKAGFPVTGFDLNRTRIEKLKRGESDMGDISQAELRRVLRTHLKLTSRPEKLKGSNCFVLCVPTPLTPQREPDLRFVASACETVQKVLKPPALVALESTSYPGTTEEYLAAPLKKKWKIGEEVFVVYSPERIDPGNRKFHLANTPKLIAGATPDCLKVGEALYRAFIEKIVPVSQLKTAELAKIYENVFRSVNVALVNELTLLCEKLHISVWEVIAAASTKPYGFMPFYPGPGLGGHCIPVDPFYLAWKAREYQFLTRFIELSGEVNWYMPYFVVYRVRRALNSFRKPLAKARLLILGVSYKPEVADTRESPSLKVMALLQENGALLRFSDPYVPQLSLCGKTHRSYPLTEKTLRWADLVLLMTPHRPFSKELILRASRHILDTRGFFYPTKSKKVELL